MWQNAGTMVYVTSARICHRYETLNVHIHISYSLRSLARFLRAKMIQLYNLNNNLSSSEEYISIDKQHSLSHSSKMWPYISLLLKLFFSVQVNTRNKASNFL